MAFQFCILGTSKFISPAQAFPRILDSYPDASLTASFQCLLGPNLSLFQHGAPPVFPISESNSIFILLPNLGVILYSVTAFLTNPICQQTLLALQYIKNLATSHHIHFTTLSQAINLISPRVTPAAPMHIHSSILSPAK